MKPMPGLLGELTRTAVKEFTLVGPADEAVTADWNGVQIEAGVFNDILEPVGADARVLASYRGSGAGPWYAGAAAVIETKAGQGRVLHFGGTFTRGNVKAFLDYAGVLEPFADTVRAPEACEIAVRRKDGQDYLFVLNFDPAAQEILLGRNMVDMDSGQRVTGPVTLPPYGTKVYRIDM